MKANWKTAFKIEHKFAQIVAKQERIGVKFNTEYGKQVLEKMDSEAAKLEARITPYLHPEPNQKGNTVEKVFKKNGELAKIVTDWIGEDAQVVGPFDRVEWEYIRPSQREKLSQQLLELGWEPTSYTEITEKGGGGNPQLTPNKEPCPNLKNISGFPGHDLQLYFAIMHKRGQLAGWIDNVRADGRISAQCNPLSTNTARVAHKVVANPPKANHDENGLLWYPEGIIPFGTEMRSLFTVDSGRKLIGCDAAGLEARILAHYMNDSWFTKELLEGDIHTKMWESCQEWVDSRSTMKNCFYAYIFGAGHYRLGITAGYQPSKAAEAGKNIDTGIRWALPALAELNDGVKRACKRGYLVGLDGRKVWMRKDKEGKIMEHKALNTLIQSAGSIATKAAMCYTDYEKSREGLDVHQVIYMHDEGQFDVKEEHTDRFMEIVENSFKQSANYFNLRVPLAGEAIRGNNWAETH